MPAGRADVGIATLDRDGLPRCQNGRRRLDRETDHDLLTGRDAAQNAAGMIGEKLGLPMMHPDLIGVFFARQRCRREA
jgi:hypothetical protein